MSGNQTIFVHQKNVFIVLKYLTAQVRLSIPRHFVQSFYFVL